MDKSVRRNSEKEPMSNEQKAPAVAGPLDQPVGRLEPERA